MPQEVLVINPDSISPMCPTDEYAIIDFRSVCRMQIILVTMAPISEIEIRGDARLVSVFGIIYIKRAIP